MSGGHFNDGGYTYYRVWQFADELAEAIANNGIEIDGYTENHSPEVIAILIEKEKEIRKITETMRLIDYLYSGDCEDDRFLERLNELEDKKPLT